MSKLNSTSIRLLTYCVLCCSTSIHAMHTSSCYPIRTSSCHPIPTSCGCSSYPVPYKGDTLLIRAILEGNLTLVLDLIDAESHLNTPNEQGDTPLMIAIERGEIEIARALIEAEVDLNTRNHEGLTALHLAAYYGEKKIVKALIEAEVDINPRSYDLHETPLILAIRGFEIVGGASEADRKKIVKALINAGADVNGRCGSGLTPLMYAVLANQPKIVKELIKAGANVNARNDGETALMIAEQKGYQEITTILINAGAYRYLNSNDCGCMY